MKTLVFVSVVVIAVVTSIVGGGEYVLMLTVTEVTTDVTVAVLTVVRIEIDVVV